MARHAELSLEASGLSADLCARVNAYMVRSFVTYESQLQDQLNVVEIYNWFGFLQLV